MNTVAAFGLDSSFLNAVNPVLVRLSAAFVAGAVLGLERQVHRQPAGLKTHILISVGSALLMIVSLMLSGGISLSDPSIARIGDPARLAAQVVSGIGFLGGGAIIRQGFNIKGLTTAATIWVSAAIGLASGLGAFLAAGVTLLIALGTLTVLERFETRFFPAKNIKTLYLVYQDKNFDYGLLERELAGVKIAVGGMDVAKTLSSDRIKFSLQIHVPPHVDLVTLTGALERAGKLLKMELTANEKSPR